MIGGVSSPQVELAVALKKDVDKNPPPKETVAAFAKLSSVKRKKLRRKRRSDILLH